ncbi:15-hydroxyprostaglandin dehydrogenase [NAD(+)]-like [Bicyclus anynana]|uniref:15-hydroxyprostaglandin dehydrogenase [NAD(+)]-like n=1 Tax=Bicyclus anynana TaxID=110368 RepID=A0A6J1N3X1_BICAN|nr:15-hydroxyprostaglandin dehydrogenase [NAD(+)]-like [Bicyclus anynana]
MSQEKKVAGKNVLITGGASGLGAAYAEAFLNFGAENIAILDIDEKGGKDFAVKLNERYKNKASFFICDISKEEEIKDSFKQVLSAFKRIDVIINNAGILDDSINAWRTACDINWQGVVSFTRKGIDHMRKDDGGKGGTIINVSSTTALIKLNIVPVYSGCKSAVLHFDRCISTPNFYNSTGVRILTMCLGPTTTTMVNDIGKKVIDKKYTNFKTAMNTHFYQSVESAVNAFLKMFDEGNPGSVWMSDYNQPGRDITSILDEANKLLVKKLFPHDITLL